MKIIHLITGILLQGFPSQAMSEEPLQIVVVQSCKDNSGQEIFSSLGRGHREAVEEPRGMSVSDRITYTYKDVSSTLTMKGLIVNENCLAVDGVLDLGVGEFHPQPELYVEYIPVTEDTRSPVVSTIMHGSVEIEWHFQRDLKNGISTIAGPFIARFKDLELVGVGDAKRVSSASGIISAQSNWYLRVPKKTIESSGKMFKLDASKGDMYQYLVYSHSVMAFVDAKKNPPEPEGMRR